MTRRKRRLIVIGVCGALLATAVTLVLVGLRDTIVFFYAPAEIVAKQVAPGERIRLGGLVAEGSVERGKGETVRFSVTDTAETIPVTYRGVLPDLFREGQGVVVEGNLSPDGVFAADTVLAKHDETYMPREVADALKKQGVWQGEGEPSGGSK